MQFLQSFCDFRRVFCAFVMPAYPATEDFFRLRLDQMTDLRHPLGIYRHPPRQERGLRTGLYYVICTKRARSGSPGC